LNGAALDRVFREAGGRITAVLASRFLSLDLAEDSLAEACARALAVWPRLASYAARKLPSATIGHYNTKWRTQEKV
jgi:predicted RNA polymerase sigma factor